MSHVHIEFCVKTHYLGTVGVRLAWSSPLLRYCCCVDCIHFDQNTEERTWYYILPETGNWRSTGFEIRGIPYHWWRSNGSVSFTMSFGGQDVYSFIPGWNEEAGILESFDQRVQLFVSSTEKEERYLCCP